MNRQNNFDLIRLLAATQVAVTHSAAHLKVDLGVFGFLHYIPGVPIFFFVSGYLIYTSYENISRNKLRTFFTNRSLRLYPGLFLCFALMLASVFLSGYMNGKEINAKELTFYTASTLTFFQFYNPEQFRGYGVGALNGSLWTISVEIQFYLLTPFLPFVFKKNRRAGALLIGIFIALNFFNSLCNPRESLTQKLVNASFAPWFYMFLTGAYIAANEEVQKKILGISPLIYLLIYILFYYLSARYDLGTGNNINAPSYLALACLVFRLAHAWPTLAKSLLRSNDISYGVYIYHMPVVNFLLFKHLVGTQLNLSIALFATFILSCLSWAFVEKPSLKLKKSALRSYT